jgi:cell division protein FtsQ
MPAARPVPRAAPPVREIERPRRQAQRQPEPNPWWPLLERAARPGVGIALAGLFLGLTLLYGATRGDHWHEVGASLAAAPDEIADAMGFQIRQVVIDGRHELSDAEILQALDFRAGRSLPFLDVDAARQRLMANPLVQTATVRKLYPDKIEIKLVERHPFALWQRDGQLYVIADDGTVIDKASGRFANLPLVVGHGADEHAHEILDALAQVPDLKSRIYAAVRVGDRRWNLRLDNGIDVKLPERGMPEALQRLGHLDATDKLLEREITEVDMRFPERLTVRLTDEAAKAEADARKKAKKRGTS